MVYVRGNNYYAYSTFPNDISANLILAMLPVHISHCVALSTSLLRCIVWPLSLYRCIMPNAYTFLRQLLGWCTITYLAAARIWTDKNLNKDYDMVVLKSNVLQGQGMQGKSKAKEERLLFIVYGSDSELTCASPTYTTQSRRVKTSSMNNLYWPAATTFHIIPQFRLTALILVFEDFIPSLRKTTTRRRSLAVFDAGPCTVIDIPLFWSHSWSAHALVYIPEKVSLAALSQRGRKVPTLISQHIWWYFVVV